MAVPWLWLGEPVAGPLLLEPAVAPPVEDAVAVSMCYSPTMDFAEDVVVVESGQGRRVSGQDA